MTFNEKSAWIMTIALMVLGLIYGQVVITETLILGETAPPNIWLISSITVVLIVWAIVSHIFVAAFDIDGVDADGDERDVCINRRAGNIAGYVLGFGLFAGLWHYFTHSDGNMLFHIGIASLMISQISQDILSINFYRRGG